MNPADAVDLSLSGGSPSSRRTRPYTTVEKERERWRGQPPPRERMPPVSVNCSRPWQGGRLLFTAPAGTRSALCSEVILQGRSTTSA